MAEDQIDERTRAMNGFLAPLLANFIRRSYGNYRTTIAGICSATVGAIGLYAPFVSPKYRALVTAGGGLLGLVATTLAKD